MSKTKNIVSLIMNIFIFTATVMVIVSIFVWHTDRLIKHSYETFRFFTTDSNILSAVASLIVAIFQIRIIRGKAKAIPKWTAVLKYIAVTSVMVTFTTVMLFLGPLYGYDFMLKGTSFYFHLVLPLLALLSFWLFEPYCAISKKQIHLAVLPMAIYGVVYLIQVLITGDWNDFYGFNTNGMWYVSIALMVIGTYALAIIIRLLHNRFVKK